ncbi:hypothetical protein GGR53DRAFT_520558 [Hypoxylon sp. FL1150]|nr:hypothetical protein GGR53DRAFT_520558 [Hypoxylon sp. FL1150]
MDQTLTLAFGWLRQDAQEVVSAATGKGKQREGVEIGAQLAFRLFQEELQNAETSLTDKQMATSISKAVQLDGDALYQLQEEERIAQGDRQLSIALNNGETEIHTSQTNTNSPADDSEFLEKLACIYITGFDGDVGDRDFCSDDETAAGDQPESSAWAASRRSRKRACEACGDMKHFAELARAPCQHEYCRECLTHLFRDAAADESLFPPRCCKQPIPLDKSQPFLDFKVAQHYRKKAVEFSSPRRVYCYVCAAFIPPANQLNDTATCADCGFRTCISCKGARHGGDCPEDEKLQQVLQLAREEGWQRCQNCWGMVELNTGCYHMTCRCGFQFCYVCGARWKTCRCVQWDEPRLYERAVEVDARDDHPEDQAREQARPQRVHRLMENLRRDHECEHRRWSYREGKYYCEQCTQVKKRFIFECKQCHILACAYCKRHRI